MIFLLLVAVLSSAAAAATPGNVINQDLETLLGDPEVTANLYCNFAYLYWEG